jgi:DNA mismatch repair protein MLH3
MSAAIQSLPEETINQLRSSFIIQSLPSCILELVQNALDAQASHIEVAFGLQNWQCLQIIHRLLAYEMSPGAW